MTTSPEQCGDAGRVTAETISAVQIREAMSLGDTPPTGNGFIEACEVALGQPTWWGEYAEHEDFIAARRRVADVYNARLTPHPGARGETR